METITEIAGAVALVVCFVAGVAFARMVWS